MRMSGRLGFRLAATITLGALTTRLPALGDSASGSISGTVRDESRGPLPGVTVEIAGSALSSTRVTVTDASGSYRVDVPSGKYEVSFKLLNFVGVVRRDVAVESGDDRVV